MGETKRGHCSRGHKDCTVAEEHDHAGCEVCAKFDKVRAEVEHG